MPLPTVDDLKEYLKVETSVDDNLLDRLRVQATALVEAYLRTPILARAVTVEVAPVFAAGNTFAQRLIFPMPFDPLGAVTVEDDAGLAVDLSDYTTNAGRGWVTFGAGYAAGDASHRVTAVAGLSLRSDYDIAVEPVLAAAVTYVVADLYQRRAPAAAYESAGGGVSITYSETANAGLPAPIRTLLAPFRRVLV